MEIKKPSARASVSFNGDYYSFITMSHGMLSYADPDVQPWLLPHDADDKQLGSTLRSALAKSKIVSIEEFHKIFNSGIIQINAQEREASLIKKYGYKSRRDMLKNMKNCSTSIIDDQIEIAPTHRKSLDTYTVTQGKGPFPLYVSNMVSDEKLGEILREALSRCTI